MSSATSSTHGAAADDAERSELRNERLTAIRNQVNMVASESVDEATQAMLRMNEFDEAIFDSNDAVLKSELVRILVQVNKPKEHEQKKQQAQVVDSNRLCSIWNKRVMLRLR